VIVKQKKVKDSVFLKKRKTLHLVIDRERGGRERDRKREKQTEREREREREREKCICK
jgi:hypothetical protein